MSDKSANNRMRFVRHCADRPKPKWYLGLDLGQRRDHSALATLELEWSAQGRCPVTFEFQFEPKLIIRELSRFPIGTSYEDLHAVIDERLRSLPQNTPARELVIDASGPGAPVVDRLRENLPGALTLKPVLITGGKGANTLTGGYTGLPRRTIVSNFRLLLAAKSLKCDKSCKNWKLLEAELLELSGESTQPARSAAHDDLAIATGLAAWAATRDAPELLPETAESKRKANGGGFFGPGRLF